jgi:FkbM family methyltransferase
MNNDIKIKDEDGNFIDIIHVERNEQDQAKKYIHKNDIVLELGARYGSVSCVINSKLDNKYNQVVVEPDEKVWVALENNKKLNHSGFHIVKGFISKKKFNLKSNGYATTSVEDTKSEIPHFDLDDIRKKYNLEFNVLIVDCEGCLETFLFENLNLLDRLRMVIFEADGRCDYKKIKKTLAKKGFKKIFEGHQNLWLKGNSLFEDKPIEIRQNPLKNKY